MMGHGMGLFGMGFFWIIGIIIFVLIILVVIKALIHSPTQSSNRNNVQQKSPLDILKERYAKGEINKEEFESKKKDLI